MVANTRSDESPTPRTRARDFCLDDEVVDTRAYEALAVRVRQLEMKVRTQAEYADHLVGLLREARPFVGIQPNTIAVVEDMKRAARHIDAALSLHEGNSSRPCQKCGQSTDVSGTYCTVAECPQR